MSISEPLQDTLYAMSWGRFLILVIWTAIIALDSARFTKKQITVSFLGVLVLVNVIGLALATWGRFG